MKRSGLLLLFLFGILQIVFLIKGNSIQAQEACTDTIFPLKSKGIIADCCIEKVENENLVIYKRKGLNYAVEAMAIIKDGLYIPLAAPEKPPVKIENSTVTPKVQQASPYKYDYNLYAKRYRTGRTIATIGGFVTIAGIAMTVGSVVSYSNGNLSYERAEALIVVGFFGFNMGMPTTIVGLVMSKKSKEAMIQTKQQSFDLSFGLTKNGVGLVINL